MRLADNDKTHLKYKKFADHFLINFNATEAAIAAGCSKKSARAQASQLLTNLNIQKYLAKKANKIFDALDIEVQDVVQHLVDMALFDVRTILDEKGDFLPIQDWPVVAARIVQGFEVEKQILYSGRGDYKKEIGYVLHKKIKLPSREKNTENLGRYLAIFKDHIKFSGELNVRGKAKEYTNATAEEIIDELNAEIDADKKSQK